MPNKLYNLHPKSNGKDSRRCKCCDIGKGVIVKYGLVVCRKCFREKANLLGFYKYR